MSLRCGSRVLFARPHEALLHGIFALVVVFFLAGDGVIWINCLTGFAWRAWLLLNMLLPGSRQ